MTELTMERDWSGREREHAGDGESFADIFERYRPGICRYLLRLVKNRDVAEDLAQDTFLKAYCALSRTPRPERLSAWLYAIATNAALSALRRRRLIAWLPLAWGGEAAHQACVPDLAVEVGDAALIGRALDDLPRQDAACLLLHFQEGLSYPELAEALGVSVAAAKMRLSRARAAFREAYRRLAEEANR